MNRTGRITSADVLKATGQKHGTIRNRLNELCEMGLLTRHGKARAIWYMRGKYPE
ncbi:MAG: winged helix-turn-helix transcriptional regulator [Armatimonadaceae bacterium]